MSVDRYVVLNSEELKGRYPALYATSYNAWCDDGYGLYLIDTHTDECVYTDAGNHECPEDMTLDRDLSIFVDLLNKGASE